MVNTHHADAMTDHRKRAMVWYSLSLLVFTLGMLLAARSYPGGYDWSYTVVSALASQKNNPVGSVWFAAALTLSMVLLWLYISAIKRALSPSYTAAGYSLAILRVGVVCGAMVGIEKLLFRDISAWLDKTHELIALLTFLGIYFGVLGLLLQLVRRHRAYALPVLLVASPMLAVGVSEFWLYLAQRDLGWLNTDWRQLGTPLWLSFAFWQWLAVALLWLGMGMLLLTVADKE
jgi:hypothetical protein